MRSNYVFEHNANCDVATSVSLNVIHATSSTYNSEQCGCHSGFGNVDALKRSVEHKNGS